MVAGRKENRNVFKQTESRLRAYPILKTNIIKYKEDIEDLRTEQVTRRSKDIVKFSISGSRLSDDEIQQGRIMDLEIKIERDQKEILEIEEALKLISGDEYEKVITLRYFKDKYPVEIGDIIGCDESTARRNSNRLVRKIAIKLYGADAL